MRQKKSGSAGSHDQGGADGRTRKAPEGQPGAHSGEWFGSRVRLFGPHTTQSRPSGLKFPRRLATAVLIFPFLAGLLGCEFDIFGPDTDTTRFTIRGQVVSKETGDPVVGARVYLRHHGIIVSSDGILAVDSAYTDGQGEYLLKTKYYCPSTLEAKAGGFDPHSGRTLGCGGQGVEQSINIHLEPKNGLGS